MTKEEFNSLIRQLSRVLYNIAFRILRSQEEAEDTVQEAFIKLWNMGKKLDEYKNIEALATTITKNLCIDQIRKRKHFVREDSENDFLRIADENSPYTLVENRETDEIIHQIIGRLPDIYKEVIRMKEIDGLSYDEIVGLTGQNISTLRVNLSRARKMIRDEFNRYQNERRGTETADRKVL